MEGFVVDELEA